MKRVRRCLTVVFLVACVGSAGVAHAATYYVSKAGSNSRSCTQAQSIGTPRLTIGAGIGCLGAGDTLIVRAGTYDDQIYNSVPSGTSWANKTRIAAYPGETVWLKPTSGLFVVHFDTSIQYVEFDGINMDGRLQTAYPFYLDASGGADPNHIRLQNAEVIAVIGVGQVHDIIFGGVTGGNEILKIKVHGGGTTGGCGTNCSGYGVYVGGPNNLVDGCDIYDTTSAGVHIYNGAGVNTSGNIIRNNHIHDITRSEDYRLWGILVSGDNNLIYNNVIDGLNFTYSSGSGNAGVYVFSGSGSKIYNNTISKNSTDGINIYSSASNVDVKNNIVYSVTGANLFAGGSGTIQSNNLFGVDPLFVSLSTNNFQLQAASPAVNTGMSLPIVTTDFLGTSRPQGGAYDIGAYEYHTGAPSGLILGSP